MNGKGGFAVFFYPQALEALGEAIKPYLQENGEVGTHVACEEIDTAGGFVEMTMRGKDGDGKDVTVELMVPGSMVRMIVSSQQDGAFGLRPHMPEPAVVPAPATGPATPVAPDLPDAQAGAKPPGA